jgi:hypothetical protein
MDDLRLVAIVGWLVAWMMASPLLVKSSTSTDRWKGMALVVGGFASLAIAFSLPN